MWRGDDTRRVVAMIARYGRPHRRALGSGLGAAVLVVAVRLAMPWPLRGVVETVFPSRHQGGHHFRPALTGFLPAFGDPVLWLAALYLLLALASGLAEMVQRVRMKQYAVGVVHGLRRDAVRSVARGGTETSGGDLLARIIGDSARVKEALSGVLVHASQNGLLFVGITAVFLVVHPLLGAVFAAGGLASIWVGFVTVPSVATVADAQRSHEGRFAETLRKALKHEDIDDADEAVDRKSASGDVRTTKLITRSAVLVHGVFGVTVGVGLWVGVRAVREGVLEPGALFLFIAYALTAHRRIVQVGRQIARFGKVLAAGGRIAALLGEEGAPGGARGPSGKPLRSSLRVEGVALAGGEAPDPAPFNVAVEAGTRVAVLGAPEHVSRLLVTLAGREPAARILWDGNESPAGEVLARIAYLPAAPAFPRGRVWRLLGLAGPWLLGDAERKSLKRIGAWRIVKASRGRLKARIGSQDLPEGGARALALGAALLGPATVLVLDRPLEGSEAEARRRRASEILRRAEGRTLLMSMSDPVKLRHFDRVLVVEAAGIVHDGPAAEFAAGRTAKAG